MFSLSKTVKPETISGFDFPLPEEMSPSLNQAQMSWWKIQYRQAVIELRKREVELATSRSFHQKTLQREKELQQRIEELEAKVRQREKELFGRRSEQSNSNTSPVKNESSKEPSPQKPRGQQKGKRGPKRRDHSHLPQKEEFISLPEDQQCCLTCGLAFNEFSCTEDSEELEIEVKAHVRKIRRKRYKKTCHCPTTPTIITAPPAAKLIPKSKLGISIWVEIILTKYLYYQPTYRFIRQWEAQGLFLSQGTITGGLEKIAPLMKPLYEAMIETQIQDSHWHADETRWKVFEKVEGKVGANWYLWVVHSPSAVIYILDPFRSARVIIEHFGDEAKGILSVDRYSAYKAMAKALDIVLAFCWAHVRRDFLKIASSWPQYETWAMSWVGAISNLYHLNNIRIALKPESVEYRTADFQLRQAIKEMKRNFERELLKPEILPSPQEAVLKSLENHWQGLILFVKNPHVPMDNNTAERDIRGPVVGRKNYTGSGAVWSGILAAMALSINQTLLLAQINPHPWWQHYLAACAQAGGEVPENYRDFLPWNLTNEQKKNFEIKQNLIDSS